MAVGKMKHKITLQRKQTTSDGGGSDSIVTWKNIATVLAAIEPQSGQERLFGDQLQEPITHIITIRYRADVSFKNRILYSYRNKGTSHTRTFNIKRIINVNSKNKFMEIMCVEGVAT